MSVITINADKCKKDNLCVEECPFNLFLEGKDGIPELADGYEDHCINCGHCISICPGDAITLNGLTGADCEKADRKLYPSKEQISQMLRSRRSIRNFKDQDIDKKDITNLIELSRWAPTAKNFQPVNWLVLTNREIIHKCSALVIDWFKEIELFPEIVEAFDNGIDMVNRDAPCLLIAHASTEALKPVTDCSIAATTIELAAPAYGIGACWAGFFMGAAINYKPLMEYLNLPEKHLTYAALMLGIPQHRYSRIPPRVPARIEWR